MTTTTEDIPIDVADAPAIDGLRFRRPRGNESDYEAMATIITAANLHDGLEEIQLARHVREELEMSVGVDPAVDVVLTEIDGRAVAESGVERTIRDGVVVYDLWGHVHPDVRRHGLGRALLRENLRRAAERAAGEPAGQVVEIRSHAQENEAGNRALLDSLGLEPIRWFFLMRRPTLDDVPDALLPDGLEFRPVTPDQHRAIFEAEVEAFRDHWSSREKTDEDLERTLKREELDTDLWVVAWDGDEIAGVVQTWVWAEENETLGVERGWLEHISVRRPWRRQGLGRAITAEALRRLAAAELTEACLGVDAENPTGALGLYEGLGFGVHQRWITYRGFLRD
jgi:mycothiol synthase